MIDGHRRSLGPRAVPARRLRSREVMTYTKADCPGQTRLPQRRFSRHSPRRLTVVALAALLFLAPGRGVGAASFGGGHGGGAPGGLNGGHMGGGNAGRGGSGEGHGGGARGEFGGGGHMGGRTFGRGDSRGRRFQQRRLYRK